MRFRYVLAPDGCVDPADRGLAYGDGIFETMAVRNAGIERFDLHLRRLRAGATRLKLPLPEIPELVPRIESLCTGIRHGALKLILTRGRGERGYRPPSQPEPTIVLSASVRESPYPEAIRVVTLEQRLAENESLAGIKHLCRLEQVLGQLELQDGNADEGLMLTTAGNAIGGTSRNVFAVLGDRLVTPDLRRAGIRGVMRQAVLDRCPALRLDVAEEDLSPGDIRRASEVFMTNALVGIQSVARLDEVTFPSRDVATRLRAALDLTPDE